MRFVASALVALVLFFPFAAHAQVSVGITVTTAPPALPDYEQPPVPAPGFVWVPGYWAWSDDGYFWVPGTWVEPPEPGLLWTPGWWGWQDDAYIFHEGYWAPQVGFYGGIDYGYGYPGNGYEGGYWRDRQFYYNRSVTNVTNTTNITNVYNQTVVNNTTENHVSFNGGQGGVRAQPTSEQRAAESAHHAGPTAAQTQAVRMASQDREQRASANAGKPPVAATPKAAEFKGRGTVAARSAGGPVPRQQPQQREQPQRGAEQQQRADEQQRGAQDQQRAQAEQQQHAQEQQRAQAEQQQHAQEQQRAQAEQQQRAQEQQRAQAEQQQRAQEQQRAAQEQQRAQAERQQRAQEQQRPIREAQAPQEKRPPANEKEQKPPSKREKPAEESPPH